MPVRRFVGQLDGSVVALKIDASFWRPGQATLSASPGHLSGLHLRNNHTCQAGWSDNYVLKNTDQCLILTDEPRECREVAAAAATAPYSRIEQQKKISDCKAMPLGFFTEVPRILVSISA